MNKLLERARVVVLAYHLGLVESQHDVTELKEVDKSGTTSPLLERQGKVYLHEPAILNYSPLHQLLKQ